MNSPSLQSVRRRPGMFLAWSVAVVLTVTGACLAQNADGPGAPVPADAPVGGATATNEFDGIRDPFWPVGYAPKPPEEEPVEGAPVPHAEVEPESVIAWPALQLRGLTKAADGSYLALIQGLGWVAKGDTVKCVKEKVLYRWVISDVGEGGVRCDRIAATPLSELEKMKTGEAGLPEPSPEQSE